MTHICLYRSLLLSVRSFQVTGIAEEIPVVSRALGLLPRFSVWMVKKKKKKKREREDPFQAWCNLEFMKQR